MCGRFALSKLPAELIDEFEIHTGKSLSKLPILPENWNVTPTQDIYIVRNDQSNVRDLAVTSWGLIAPWAKDATEALRSQSQAINARSETVDQKPTFKSAFRSRRCLIPVDGYYEWATELGPFAPKQPFYIKSREWEPSRKSLALAGIWDRWIDPDGVVKESAAIITRPAVDFLATVHRRMPTLLPVDRWDRWLDNSLRDVDEIKSLMELSEPAKNLVAIPVSSAVNKTANNGIELTFEVPLGEPTTLF